mmetsp:Transcript_1910/g.4764  ORF Transcript_1910/g.4764 Transcript_1910/m.4764 type:complete len:108 (+) Transcript_1910:1856-2179(+)
MQTMQPTQRFTDELACPALTRLPLIGWQIPFLKELGVNALELLPVFEYDELEFQRSPNPRDHMVNIWGYSHMNFFCAHESLCRRWRWPGGRCARVQGDGQGAARGRH